MVNGKVLRDAIISASNHISAHCQEVNELNVFPVPDGDTGTNMSMTISSAARELAVSETGTASEVADITASALLRGARGNSGVILSLLFRGFAKGLKGVPEASGRDLARSLALGVESAYKAVMKPTEGTILTVARVAAEKAKETAEETEDAVAIWETVCRAAADALATTPELLPVLKKAGVVDAGGKGVLLIFEGMLSVFRDGRMIEGEAQGGAAPAPAQKNAVAEWEGEITFTYCTEFIVKRSGTSNDPLQLRAYLETIGDCVVVVDDDKIIKVHVHTDNPGKAVQKGLSFGQLVNIKIENMRDQNERAKHEAELAAASAYTPAPKENKFGFVAVAAGSGVQQLFRDLGADAIVSGGQTMNPSTDDILKAIETTPAETVFVLPNNKNIIMAAEQAVPLATRRVYVLQTRTIPMGISALLAFDPDGDSESNLLEMTKAAENVGTGQLTFAARNSDFDGKNIREGEILALENGKLSFTDADLTHAAVRLTRSLYKKDSSFITLIYGEDVSEEQAEAVKNAVAAKLPNAEITIINGGQPVYFYIISVE